jgi:hypothetical protein
MENERCKMKEVAVSLAMVIVLAWAGPMFSGDLGRLSMLVPSTLPAERSEPIPFESVQVDGRSSGQIINQDFPLDHNMAVALKHLGYDVTPGQQATSVAPGNRGSSRVALPLDRNFSFALSHLGYGTEASPSIDSATDQELGSSDAPLPLCQTLTVAYKHLGYDTKLLVKPRASSGSVSGSKVPAPALSHNMEMALNHLGYDTSPTHIPAPRPIRTTAPAPLPVSSHMRTAMTQLGYH